jgi:hypothetical protein
MRNSVQFTRILIVLLLLMVTVTSASAKKSTSYQTGIDVYRAAAGDGDFENWSLDGVTLSPGGVLVLDPATSTPGSDPYTAGSYYGGNYYNGGNFFVGEAVSPEVSTPWDFSQAIASWNAYTPDGTWVEILISARYGTRWTKDYVLGIWASGEGTVQRHSVKLQGDSDGYVAVDTLVLTAKKETANGYRLKVRLFSEDNLAVPTVRSLSLAYSNTPPKKAPPVSAGNSANWNTLLNVPECSQMVYPDGGNVWCSPTSTSMVLGSYGFMPGPCEPRVRATVAGVYDWIYDGHGNWPFNTAYAADQGYEAYVARFTSLTQVEDWVKAGVPVVVSYAWGKNDLTGAAISSSAGHLSVIVGFDDQGNPIVNDPAASLDADVQRTYLRGEFEALWLTNSGGTVYLIYPAGTAVPPL